MVVVYLIYGFAFLVAGVLLGFQARLSSVIVPRAALVCFAAFALTHGVAEWVKMATLVPLFAARWFHEVAAILAAISYFLLLLFGVELYGAPRRWSKRTRRRVALALVGVFAVLVVGVVVRGASRVGAIDALSRYVFCLPGAVLAAVSLFELERERRLSDELGSKPYLGVAAGWFAVYAVLAGLVPSKAAFFPATHFNTASFFAVTGIPIEILRTICALAIVGFLTEALVIQMARERAEAEKRREEFIAMVAHELRSPLGAIRLGATFLERGGVSGDGAIEPERARRVLENIRRSAFGLERMITDLLDASRIEVRALALNARDVELNPLIGGIIERAHHELRGHSVRTIVPASTPRVHVDPERVEQVVENLLSNAAKYGAPDTDIIVEAMVRAAEIELAITNRGAGLSPKEASQVFSRFYRSAQHSRSVDGLGLGLYIAKELVVAQGGRMWLESEPGLFTTFRFTLPRSDCFAACAT